MISKLEYMMRDVLDAGMQRGWVKSWDLKKDLSFARQVGDELTGLHYDVELTDGEGTLRIEVIRSDDAGQAGPGDIDH